MRRDVRQTGIELPLRRQTADGRCDGQLVRARRGVTLLELIASGILLATVTAVAVPALAAIVRERQATWQRHAALAEAGNILERLSAAPWDDLPAAAANVELPSELKRQCPDAEVRVAVEAVPDHADARRIRVVLTWTGRAGQPPAAVWLTAWRYRQGGAE